MLVILLFVVITHYYIYKTSITVKYLFINYSYMDKEKEKTKKTIILYNLIKF